jgi:hypothetical protein
MKEVKEKLGEGRFNTVYKVGDRVEKEPKESTPKDKIISTMNDSKRAARIGNELYPDLKIEISSDNKSWSMPFFEHAVTSADDKECAEEILRIYRENRRRVLDGCRLDNFRKDQNKKLYLIDYDVCVRRGSTVSDQYCGNEYNQKGIKSLWDWYKFYMTHEIVFTVGIIEKLEWLEEWLAKEKLDSSEIKNDYLKLDYVWQIQLNKEPTILFPTDDKISGRTWQKAHDAANAYLKANEYTISSRHGKDQTKIFLEKLEKISKNDPESVRKEVINWTKGYNFWKRESSSRKDSREDYVKKYELL